MLDPPPIDEETIARQLADGWRVAATGLEFLPLGNDCRTWAYRAALRGGRRLFVKLRSGPVNAASVEVPAYLHRTGIAGLVAPLATGTGALWRDLGEYRMSAYPFVDELDTTLAPDQWRRVGETLGAVHRTRLPAEVADGLGRDGFVPRGAGLLGTIEELVRKEQFIDDAQAELGRFWLAHAVHIDETVRRAFELGAALAARRPPEVLCHGDCHRANILVDAAGGVFLVDWDEVTFAPAEYDLKFFSHGEGEAAFAAVRGGYGSYEIDQAALAYYGYEWLVADLIAYAEQVLLLPAQGLASRWAAVAGLRSLFESK